MSEKLISSIQIKPGLVRYPRRDGETLQAWDAADELILDAVAERLEKAPKNPRILILGDSFGALAASLPTDTPVYTDSYVSTQAILINTENRARLIHDLDSLSGEYDLVLIRIPKNMSFFEDELAHLTGHLAPGAEVICGYMIKHQSKASFDLLNQYIGATSTSLARKKARLILSKFAQFAQFHQSPVKSPYPLQVKLDGFEIPFTHHSGLFSREKLDIGTRFFLEHLPQGDYPVILDLGCANGVIGIAAKRLNPRSRIILTDESEMAIQSARANFAKYFPDETTQAEFKWIHCYENQEPASVDLVLCNPPFHQGNTIGDRTAWQMFTDSKRALRPGGVLRVIGNNHLLYGDSLKKIFGNSRVVAKNQKFTILDAVK